MASLVIGGSGDRANASGSDASVDIATKLNQLLETVTPPSLSGIKATERLNLLAVSPRNGDVVAIDTTNNQLVYACTSDLASPAADAAAASAAAFKPLGLENAAKEPQVLPPETRLTRIRFVWFGMYTVEDCLKATFSEALQRYDERRCSLLGAITCERWRNVTTTIVIMIVLSSPILHVDSTNVGTTIPPSPQLQRGGQRSSSPWLQLNPRGASLRLGLFL